MKIPNLIPLILLSLYCGHSDQNFVIFKPSAVVRSSPSVSSEQMGNLEYGSKVTVTEKSKEEAKLLGETGHWCKIQSETLTGWVFCPLLKQNLDSYFKLLNAGNLTRVDLGTPMILQEFLSRSEATIPFENLTCSDEIIKDRDLVVCPGSIRISQYGNNTEFRFGLIPRHGESGSGYSGKPGYWSIQDGQLVLHGIKSFDANNYNQDLDCFEISGNCTDASIVIGNITKVSDQYSAKVVQLNSPPESKCKFYCTNETGTFPIAREKVNP